MSALLKLLILISTLVLITSLATQLVANVVLNQMFSGAIAAGYITHMKFTTALLLCLIGIPGLTTGVKRK